MAPSSSILSMRLSAYTLSDGFELAAMSVMIYPDAGMLGITIASHLACRHRACPKNTLARASLFRKIYTDDCRTMNSPVTGYAEGFYGRLLSWADRRQIVDALQHLGLTTYYYAPKEDPCHRLHWRTPYHLQWREEFRRFCAYAHEGGVRVVAGVAPGLDFDFAELPDSQDFQSLVTKSMALLDDGADVISLLMDDIDADFEKRSGRFHAEGEAHAELANALGDALSGMMFNTDGADPPDTSIWVTPRIYADELIAEAENYLPTFVLTLKEHHRVLYCGSDVVAHTLDADAFNALRTTTAECSNPLLKHRVIIWDNLYANDYCPRRLFVGPWERRSAIRDVLLNPTGLVNTDCLLLELMAIEIQQESQPESERQSPALLWQAALGRHGIPDVFTLLAPYFYHPHFNTVECDKQITTNCIDNDEVRTAIEHCLWRWKTPLSREWYTFIFGLKHDLLTHAGQHSTERILKTQSRPLARMLLAVKKQNQ
ncbi:MAG: beta-N-acetylglucosaminidase domain-containing protein [Granulosicoccus sp.]